VLLDGDGNVIEGTRSNLFMVRDGELLTPDLSRCGVAGVQRERVMEWAKARGMPCQIRQFDLAELLAADEIFLVNSIIGLWPVRELQSRNWHQHPVARQVQEWLNRAAD
jgi:4-amino-4-deoxychorismate lyase